MRRLSESGALSQYEIELPPLGEEILKFSKGGVRFYEQRVRFYEQGVFVFTNSTNNRSNQITDQKILRIILIILRMIEHALQQVVEKLWKSCSCG